MPTRRHDTLNFKTDLARRLRCAEGHLRAIARMIETGADCYAPHVLQQMVAVQGALCEVNRRLVKHYLDDCLPGDLQAAEPALRGRALEEVVALYELICGHPRPLGRKEIA